MDPVVHFEVPADDSERARRFTSRLSAGSLRPIPSSTSRSSRPVRRARTWDLVQAPSMATSVDTRFFMIRRATW